MCYFCTKVSGSPNELVHHQLKYHQCEGHTFSLRRRVLSEKSGVFIYESQHYNITLADLAKRLHECKSVIIDTDNVNIRFKRESMAGVCEDKKDNTLPRSEHADTDDTDLKPDVEAQLLKILPQVLEALTNIGRRDDFVSVISSLASGELSVDNMALNLLLDIGRYLSCECTKQMRYTRTSLDFWLIIQKLFKGKAIRFFRGIQSDDINFAVPSSKVLQRESAKFQLDAKSPGLIRNALEAFSDVHRGQDCKLSLDGKKIAYGFGQNLGEEDLSGHEARPTLQERKNRLNEELNILDAAQARVSECDQEDLGDIPVTIKQELVCTIKDIMQMLSVRISELRLQCVKKKRAVQNLMGKINGPWRESSLAQAISYLQTQVIQCDACINRLLQCIDDAGYLAAVLNGTHSDYKRGFGVEVDFQKQGNYICLRNLQKEEALQYVDPRPMCENIKQRSDAWHDLRSGARVTGSTLYKTLGCSTLKDQQQHFNKAFKGHSPEVSPELKAMFEYGTANEVNALATLLAKIIPVYYPGVKYREDGCIVMDMSDSAYAVISGDGTGIDSSGKSQVAFELKCPIPGKQYAPDVYYTLPVYYSAQVISQMASKKCTEYANVCYSPQSSTFITGCLDNDLWWDVWGYACELYAGPNIKCPSRKSDKSTELSMRLKQMSSHSAFRAEMPSVRGIQCGCTETVKSSQDLFHQHQGTVLDVHERTEAVLVTLESSKNALQDAYNLIRRPAKELLLGVISDLDRTSQSNCPESTYAVPFMYNLTGSSLKMDSVRSLIQERVKDVNAHGITVKVIAFDGQFLELSLTDYEHKPITLCRLDKMVWDEAKRVQKEKQVAYFAALNNIGSVSSLEDLQQHCSISKLSNGQLVVSMNEYHEIYIPRDLTKYLTSGSSGDADPSTDNPATDIGYDSGTYLLESEGGEDYILQYLPHDIVAAMDQNSIDAVRMANAAIAAKKQESRDQDQAEEVVPPVAVNPVSMPEILNVLNTSAQEGKPSGRKHKWDDITVSGLSKMMSNAESIMKSFTVKELEIILRLTGKVKTGKERKAQLANRVSEMYGDGTFVTYTVNIPKLRTLSLAVLKKLPKVCTNMLYATNVHQERKRQYENHVHFKSDHPYVIATEDQEFVIHHWYAQPTMMDGIPVQFIIDPHHLYVNNRCRCCRAGMAGMDITPAAWIRVAHQECNKPENMKTGLSVELVEELRDRQRNSFAATTFSEKVEKAMLENGDTTEANWCWLLRNWYAAVDEPGLGVSTRIQYLLDMRQHLLKFYKPGTYPPPASYVAGLPIAQFEGILCNVDRRLQLFATTKDGKYNQRSISSLDSETMFGSFQDIDPKGTGVLRADDIPAALGTAVCLFKHKLDPNRKFPMNTSRKRVYIDHPLSEETPSSSGMETRRSLIGTRLIVAKTHFFDHENRKSKNPRRKSGTIGTLSQSSRGAQGVRSHHKINEEKILPHRRAGLDDFEVDKLL